MGRFVDLIVLLVAVFLVITMQFTAAQILYPMQDKVIDDEIQDKYNAEENTMDMITAVVKWAPMIGLFGLTGIIVIREYRRQRVAGARGGGGPGI